MGRVGRGRVGRGRVGRGRVGRRAASALLLAALVIVLGGQGPVGASDRAATSTSPPADGPGAVLAPAGSRADSLILQADVNHQSVPTNLVPSLANAANDLGPSYRDGCHTSLGSPVIHPCVYGNHAGTVTIVLFGDSHAAQWLPALIKASVTKHWRIVSLTHSSCPSAQVITGQQTAAARAACATWRRRAITWIRNHPPKLVLLANYRAYVLLDAGGHPIPAADRESAWKRGLAQTLHQLPASAKALVLADTPKNRVDVPKCLMAHLSNVAACQTARRVAISAPHDGAEQAAAAQAGATFADLDSVICPSDPCPLIDGHVLLYRDPSHLTATYSRQLAPSLAAIVANHV